MQCLTVLHFVGAPKPFEIDFSNESRWEWEHIERKDYWSVETLMEKKRWAFELWRSWADICLVPTFKMKRHGVPTVVTRGPIHPLQSSK